MTCNEICVIYSSSISGAELLSFTENGGGAKYFSTTATAGDASTGTDAEAIKGIYIAFSLCVFVSIVNCVINFEKFLPSALLAREFLLFCLLPNLPAPRFCVVPFFF